MEFYYVITVRIMAAFKFGIPFVSLLESLRQTYCALAIFYRQDSSKFSHQSIQPFLQRRKQIIGNNTYTVLITIIKYLCV